MTGSVTMMMTTAEMMPLLLPPIARRSQAAEMTMTITITMTPTAEANDTAALTAVMTVAAAEAAMP